MIIFLDQEDKENFLLASDCLHLKVLYYIIKQVSHDTNPWHADMDNKESIMDKLEISLATMNRQVNILKNNKIIIQKSRGKYMLNINMLKL